MKKLLSVSAVLILLICCNKAPETCSDGIMNQDEIQVDCGGMCSPCPVTYSSTGNYGNNILFGNDTLNLTIGNYSFEANVPEGSSLVIEIELISGSEWFYSIDSNGWVISSYNAGSQTFTVPNSGGYDLNFSLAYSPDPNVIGGLFNIHYKENGATLTKTKVVIWS